MRYLFIDKTYVQRTDQVTRVFHEPTKAQGPVVAPDRPWEEGRLHIWSPPIWSEEKNRWQMWYYGGEGLYPLYAESTDGLNWEKPVLSRRSWQGSSENNMINLGFDVRGAKENRIVLLRDDREQNPAQRYKGLTRVSKKLKALVSADGLDWSPLEGDQTPSNDEYRLSYDALQHRFVATAKGSPVPEFGRSVSLSVSSDFVNWTPRELVFWGDEVDQELGRQRIEANIRDRDLRTPMVIQPEYYHTDVYNMALFTYEDMYLGLPIMFNHSGVYWYTPPGRPESERGSNQDGILYPALVTSRDLYHWERPSREPFIRASRLSDPDNWDYASVYATPPVKQDDELRFYYTGNRFTHVKRQLLEERGLASPEDSLNAIFLACLRVDGFASLYAGGTPGVVLTKPVEITDSTLYVNADAADGELRVELRDADTGEVLPGYSLGDYAGSRYIQEENGTGSRLMVGTGARLADDPVEDTTVPITEDTTCTAVHWQGGSDLTALKGRRVRLHFHLRNTHLYSFWFA